MRSLIGNQSSAKFIFFCCEKDYKLPNIREVKKTFDTENVNYYVHGGHFSSQIQRINSMFHIFYGGNGSLNNWINGSYISIILRLDASAERQLFFDLTHFGTIVTHLHLNNNLLSELESFTNSFTDLSYRISRVTDLKEQLKDTQILINQLSIQDETISNPTSEALDHIFNNFGDPAKAEIVNRLQDWYQRAYWKSDV